MLFAFTEAGRQAGVAVRASGVRRGSAIGVKRIAGRIPVSGHKPFVMIAPENRIVKLVARGNVLDMLAIKMKPAGRHLFAGVVRNFLLWLFLRGYRGSRITGGSFIDAESLVGNMR